MARYKAHVLGGFCCYLIILLGCGFHGAPLLQRMEWLLWTVVGSLFPDIDVKSKGQQLVYTLLALLLLLLICAQRYMIAAWIGAAAMIPIVTKHRGVWHELWFLGCITAAGSYQLMKIFPAASTRIMADAAFFGLGFISHLVLDGYLRRLVRW